MAGIGVFVCWCGTNIASTVDVNRVAEAAAGFPGVVHSTTYKYMCSEPGQNLIINSVREKGLDGIVVASCSPHLHQQTFARATVRAGLNPYLCEMANIREHCSWVHQDREKATHKAIDIVGAMVAKVRQNTPLTPINIPVTTRALVIGGGIAGIQTALDIAAGNQEVILVEREPSIGGHMSQLSKTFPTLDCSQCILTPKMVEVGHNERIRLYTYAQVEEVNGYIGNFEVKIRKKARSVDEEKCTGCGVCWSRCPAKKILSEFDIGLGRRAAIYTPFPQAVPNIPVIDRKNCIYFTKGKCKVCEKFCPSEAIKFDQEDEIITEKVGAMVVATGFDVFDEERYGEYGEGSFKDVINSLQFERILSATGPTQGRIKRPSDGKEPKNVVFIQCVGSRDISKGISYCSKICCMYSAKHAMLYKHKVPDGGAYIFYMDIRAGGKNYEEFVRQAIEQEEVIYLQGRVSRLFKKDEKIVVRGADTLSGNQVEIKADLVVLATAITAQKDAAQIAQKIGISYDGYNFFTEAHPKLRPIETNTPGIFLAGACQAPKDIPESVAQGTAAAAKVLELFSKHTFVREPLVACVDGSMCNGCFFCNMSCPYHAIDQEEVKVNLEGGEKIKTVAKVNQGKCQGCGICVSACPSKAVMLEGFTDQQIYEEVTHAIR